LPAILKDTLKKDKTHNLRPIKNNLRRLLRVKNALLQDNFKIKNMYKSILTIFSIAIFSISCNSSRNLANIQPKTGNLDISAKGELRVWNNIKHSSFDVVLTNTNENQSCELYYVKSNGTEKWINPSLQAKSSVTVNIPTDGHLFIKNFNPNNLTISYKINE
jgi:hypothetical protein